MTADSQLIDSALRDWKHNVDRIEAFLAPLSDEQLQQEVAPGRNRLLYLAGHLAAVHDRLFPLLGIGPRLHPELDPIFLETPDRSAASTPPAAELKRILTEVDLALWSAFQRWTPAEWLARHTAVSESDFAREPHRNRFTVMLARNTHMAFHYGQMILVKPRE